MTRKILLEVDVDFMALKAPYTSESGYDVEGNCHKCALGPLNDHLMCGGGRCKYGTAGYYNALQPGWRFHGKHPSENWDQGE